MQTKIYFEIFTVTFWNYRYRHISFHSGRISAKSVFSYVSDEAGLIDLYMGLVIWQRSTQQYSVVVLYSLKILHLVIAAH